LLFVAALFGHAISAAVVSLADGIIVARRPTYLASLTAGAVPGKAPGTERALMASDVHFFGLLAKNERLEEQSVSAELIALLAAIGRPTRPGRRARDWIDVPAASRRECLESGRD
jgi:hypothetical protein